METILIVDDNEDLRWNLSNLLQSEGYEVVTADNGKRAVKAVKKKSPDCALLDIRLPGMDGIQTLEEIKKTNHDVIVIMLTAFADTKDAVKAMKSGAYDYITKPFDNEELVLVIKKALQTRHLSKEVERLKHKLSEQMAVEKVTGDSSQIRHVLSQVNIIAPTDMTVIIQGESGTGKEVIANLIHKRSSRKEKPFTAVDCGALPDTLAESELFGYEKGAFTGADARKEGKFEQANEGTLFLDEITNLSNAIQMKLLRVIQERKLQHLGGRRDIRVNVRIIVATNMNLSETVQTGQFRDDLFHRLNEFQIDLPPLRERTDDILVLAQHFLENANIVFDKNIKGFSPESMKALLDNHWPGNVRELQNVIKRAVLLADRDMILPLHLSMSPTTQGMGVGIDLEKRASLASLRELTDKATREVEKSAIQQALAQSGGNKTKAAEILKIDRMTLYSKMKKLKLS